MKKIGLVSLGCPKNLVDSEALLGDLKLEGCEISPNADEAEVLIVNTCGFLQSAVKESVETILEMAEHKTNGQCQRLIVTGCLAERHPDELLKEIPEIDHLLGVKQYPILKTLLNGSQDDRRNLVHEPAQYFEQYGQRVLTTPSYTAYVKIAEGCSNQCAFCVIPQMRGAIRSRPIDALVTEVRQLAEQGVKEINLVSQDTTLYGYDLKMKEGLVQLLEELSAIKGVEWLRLFYCYPTMVTQNLMNAMARLDKVVPYMDVPLQHSHDFMLKHMKRQETEDGVRRMIDNLRKHIPGLALRTTFITGFPGETEEHFNHLHKFVEEIEFDHLGVFVYSDEEGTTAFDYSDKVPESIASERRDAIMQTQQGIAARKNKDKIGETHPVLVEGVDDDCLLTGRLPTQGPDIDGVVIIENSDIPAGEIVPMKITSALDYDLVATCETLDPVETT